MKILSVFIDMVPSERMHLCNEGEEKNSLDRFLEQLGGTIYTNCYTPAPDTPRSSACMWTGLYPKANGCNTRGKYPGYFFEEGTNNLWKALKDSGYDSNVFMRKSEGSDLDLRLLTEEFYGKIFSGKLDDFLEQLVITENSFTFLYLPDLHIHLDNNSYSRKGYEKGINFVSELLQKILDKFSADLFDSIIIFSDHGFRLKGDDREHLLDSDRTKTLLFIHGRNDKGIKTDQELRSNLDLYPTICQLINYSTGQKTDGSSLMGKGHEYVLMEDHDNFSVNFGLTIEHWGVATEENIHWLDCDGIWKSKYLEKKAFDKCKYEKLIVDKMDCYEENRKMYEIIHKYRGNVFAEYSDGSSIKISAHKKNKLYFFLSKILEKVKKLRTDR